MVSFLLAKLTMSSSYVYSGAHARESMPLLKTQGSSTQVTRGWVENEYSEPLACPFTSGAVALSLAQSTLRQSPMGMTGTGLRF